jgi:hypothetical protein
MLQVAIQKYAEGRDDLYGLVGTWGKTVVLYKSSGRHN